MTDRYDLCESQATCLDMMNTMAINDVAVDMCKHHHSSYEFREMYLRFLDNVSDYVSDSSVSGRKREDVCSEFLSGYGHVPNALRHDNLTSTARETVEWMHKHVSNKLTSILTKKEESLTDYSKRMITQALKPQTV